MIKKHVIRIVTFFLFFILTFALFTDSASAKSKHIPIAKKYKSYSQFIVIDKSENKLTYYEKGKAIKTFSVATGKKQSYTPEGLWSISEKIKNRPYYVGNIKGGDPRNPLGDRWLGLNVKIKGKRYYGYAIHGNNNPKSIGTYASLGCIRMHNDQVRWLYNKVKVGTKVLIQK